MDVSGVTSRMIFFVASPIFSDPVNDEDGPAEGVVGHGQPADGELEGGPVGPLERRLIDPVSRHHHLVHLAADLVEQNRSSVTENALTHYIATTTLL